MCSIENGLKAVREQAIEYIKYTHALELAAGMNFRAVRHDLDGRGIITQELWASLHRAQVQEASHAQILRNMLTALGYTDLHELMSMPRAIYDGLADGVALRWPAHLDAWARMEFNYALEHHFSEGGLDAWASRLSEFAYCELRGGEREKFLYFIDHFKSLVEPDEAWHVQIGLEINGIYRKLYPHYDMKGLLANVNVVRSPFIHVIRARQAFLRSLPPQVQGQQQDGGPDSHSDQIDHGRRTLR